MKKKKEKKPQENKSKICKKIDENKGPGNGRI